MRIWFKPGAVDVPVPPFATASVPPNDKVPDVVIGPPVKVRPVVLPVMLTEVTVPRPRDDVATADTTPFVPKRRPFRDDASVVEPVTTNEPVVVVAVTARVPVVVVAATARVPLAVMLAVMVLPLL